MSNEYPLIGEILNKGGWDVQCWTKDGQYYDDGDKSCFDLVPIEPAELEGLKVGEPVFIFHKKLQQVKKLFITYVDCTYIWVADEWAGNTKCSYSLCFNIDGIAILPDMGTSELKAYRSKERALASMKEGNNVD